jgi:DNA-binding SARP family transcriptional activator
VIGRTLIARRLEATLALTALLLVLALSWELRPSLPQLPRSLSAPLPSSTIGATLELAAWIVFVLLDLVLIRRVLQFAVRREPTRTESRLRRAFAGPQKLSIGRPTDWRAHAAPLAPPVLRLASRTKPESEKDASKGVPPRTESEPAAEQTHAPAGGSDERIGVLLLGPLELVGCKKKQPRRQATAELIAYLALQPRQVTRDQLLEALWPGEAPRRSADRLYQAATEARKLLGGAFQRGRDAYQLDRRQLWIDLDDLERLRVEAEAANVEQERDLRERALALFRAEPLAGIDAFWADGEARRLRALEVELLERTGRLRLQAREWTGALEAAERARTLDSSNERTAQLAMEVEAALGRREAVVERYEQLCRELDERFGLEPSHDTKLLYRRLLSQDAAEGSDPSARRRSAAAIGSGKS